MHVRSRTRVSAATVPPTAPAAVKMIRLVWYDVGFAQPRPDMYTPESHFRLQTGTPKDDALPEWVSPRVVAKLVNAGMVTENLSENDSVSATYCRTHSGSIRWELQSAGMLSKVHHVKLGETVTVNDGDIVSVEMGDHDGDVTIRFWPSPEGTRINFEFADAIAAAIVKAAEELGIEGSTPPGTFEPGFIEQPTTRIMGVDAPDFGEPLGAIVIGPNDVTAFDVDGNKIEES